MRRVLYVLAPIALIVVVVIGLTQAAGGDDLGDGKDFDLPAAKAELAQAPAPLNALYSRANELLGGSELDAQLNALKGTPVVLNKWASWCVPCRTEFPVFQNAAVKHGKEVAFVGLDGGDKDPAAKRFLAERPLPFPSFTDPDDKIAASRNIGVGFPMTQFIARDGSVAYTHTGPYTSEQELTEDIEQYLR